MPSKPESTQVDESWSIERARTLYNVPGWSEGYFDVSPGGDLVVRAGGTEDAAGVSLAGLARELAGQGLHTPVLVRFPHILDDRLRRLGEAFGQAMDEAGYGGRYTPVYPVKVNQQRYVVDRILHYGSGRVGLEAGSKPELLAVMALMDGGGSTIICNGYKDREYIRLALIGTLLGHRVFIVIEQPSELALIAAESAALGVRPSLGVRVRLASIAGGNWQNSGGDQAKFGLSAIQMVGLLDGLRRDGLLDCLRLMHLHMGSQIPDIRDFRAGLREAGRYYAALREAGAPVSSVDIGGGLGVDYEGTASTAYCSANYSLRDYARTAVQALSAACAAAGQPRPEILTEDGRAMTAHHAVLVTNVLEAESMRNGLGAPDDARDGPDELQRLRRLAAQASHGDPGAVYRRACGLLDEVQALFVEGGASLAQRARAGQLFYQVCAEVLRHTSPRTDRELHEALEGRLADKYFLNMSVFQSIPDVWALNQIFPVVPLQRLDERPSRHAILHDMTCDSDGRMRSYVDAGGIRSTLPVHPLRPGDPYLLGIFLVGAYQEILGDCHNLFGDTHSVNVELLPDGRHRMYEPESGDTVEELLKYVHYDPGHLVAVLNGKLDRSGIRAQDREVIRRELEDGLRGYTYLED